MNPIYIQITVDADGLIQNYPNPSKKPDSPTNISHQYAYLVASSDALSGSGIGELRLHAHRNEKVRLYGTSASNNFDSSVLLYAVKRFGGDHVFSTFKPVSYEAIEVAPSIPNTLPAETDEYNDYNFIQARVKHAGGEWYGISFAMYTRNDMGEPELYGYFQWGAMFVVQEGY